MNIGKWLQGLVVILSLLAGAWLGYWQQEHVGDARRHIARADRRSCSLPSPAQGVRHQVQDTKARDDDGAKLREFLVH